MLRYSKSDLPWWFEIYHTAWILAFAAVWYFFGWVAFFTFLMVTATYFAIFS